MTSTAVVFPGQGAQRAGMARDFHERFAASREAFAEASEAIALDVAALCFEEDARLDRTEFTQPAILTAEIAMLRGLTELGLKAEWYGGHSLGEYTALVAAGAMPLRDAVQVVRRRGALMQTAVPLGEGTMVAVIGEGVAAVNLGPALAGLEVDVANKNSASQVVLSGAVKDMDAACARVREAATGVAVEFVPLTVSAPFHSRRMRAIEAEFRGVLDEVAPRIDAARAKHVTSNLLGTWHTGERDALLDALTRQISGAVDWIANMNAIATAAETIYEVGPNRPLRGFFKAAGREITSIVSLKAGEKALAG